MTVNTSIAIFTGLSWHERVSLARMGSPIARELVQSIREEANEFAAKRYADWRVHIAIAQSAQSVIDAIDSQCLPEDMADYFDELDALMADDGPEYVASENDTFWRDSFHAINAGMGEL